MQISMTPAALALVQARGGVMALDYIPPIS